MENKLKIGVIGVGRGLDLITYCTHDESVELVAICDKWEPGLKRAMNGIAEQIAKGEIRPMNITTYTNYDEFLKHDMDAVILANYAPEHAPFAIKALRAGKHVISEVIACSCLAEAVELIETVEETGLTYCYAENYCYMSSTYEMRKLYREGKIGELQYAEGEYIHNTETGRPTLTRGESNHWRNTGSAFYYCTHSLGPIVHSTGLRPVKVTGFEVPFSAQCYRSGLRNGAAGVELVTLENGAIVRSTHGNLKQNSIWYSMQGTKGAVESEREMSLEPSTCTEHIYAHFFAEDDSYSEQTYPRYMPSDLNAVDKELFGHGGSDYRCLSNAMRKIRGDESADTIDIYEALDMALPGLFAHLSITGYGREQEIPNLRFKEERDKWRNDRRSVYPGADGLNERIPTTSNGTPVIPQEVYDRIREKYVEEWKLCHPDIPLDE